jgi:hypothetical protein
MFGRKKKKPYGWMDGSVQQHPKVAATIKTKKKLYKLNDVTICFSFRVLPNIYYYY